MAADPTAGLFFHPLFWLLRLPDHKLESSSCFPHLSQHTPHCGETEECENSQAGPGRAGRANETKIFGFSRILKSRTSCYIAWLSWEKWTEVFAVISGCLQPLQLRLCEFAPRLCFQDSLLYLCLGRPFFLSESWLCKVIMAIWEMWPVEKSRLGIHSSVVQEQI